MKNKIRTYFVRIGTLNHPFKNKCNRQIHIFPFKTFRLIAGFVVLITFCGPMFGLAEEISRPAIYPAKPVKIIVPYGPGGGSHQMAVMLAKSLADIMRVEVEVITMPGNNSKKGISYYESLPPDGYSILQHVDILASLYASGELEEKPLQNLTPVAITQITFSQIYIRNIEPRFYNWSGFLQYAVNHSGELKIATTGSPFSLEQVSMAMLADKLNFKLLSKTYDRPAERYMALIEGEVDALFEQPGDVAPFLNRKLIKPILTFLPDKIDAFKATPTLKDISVDFPLLYRFRGFFIHSAVAKEIQSYLEACFEKAYRSSSFSAFNQKKYMNLIDSYKNSEDARELIMQAVMNYAAAADRHEK